MKVGGNKQMNDFLSSHGVHRKSSIKKKYNSSAAALYREVYIFIQVLNVELLQKLKVGSLPLPFLKVSQFQKKRICMIFMWFVIIVMLRRVKILSRRNFVFVLKLKNVFVRSLEVVVWVVKLLVHLQSHQVDMVTSQPNNNLQEMSIGYRA